MQKQKRKEHFSLMPLRVVKHNNIAIAIVGRAITIERKIKERSKKFIAKI